VFEVFVLAGYDAIPESIIMLDMDYGTLVELFR
jgi:hypothetical protein